MTRRRGQHALVLITVVSFFIGGAVGLAWANHGHTRNGIYHGPYFEYRQGNDYHHNWTEHGHDGYRWVASYGSGGVLYASRSNANSNYREQHVDVTTWFENPGHGRYKTKNPNATNQCTGEQNAGSYGDGHGMCAHRMDEGAH